MKRQPERVPHDLRLPAWGPYTKRYIGISHIADPTEGIRFDASVVPGLHRRGLAIPNVMFESGYHPWEAAPDLGYFSHRHQLEWKDRVYADVSFSRVDDSTSLIRADLVNRTGVAQNLVLHYFASLHFPAATHDKTFTPLRPARVRLPSGAVWVDAMDYREMLFARPKPNDHLVPEGLRRGETRGDGFVRNRGLGGGFGREKGDAAVYGFSLERSMADAVLLIRHRLPGTVPGRFRLEGLVAGDWNPEPADGFCLTPFPLGTLEAGAHSLRLESVGGGGVEIDGFTIVAETGLPEVAFSIPRRDPVPEVMEPAGSRGVVLKYRELSHWYGLAWDFDAAILREICHSELDIFLRLKVHDHFSRRLTGDGKGHFANVMLAPVFLPPRSERSMPGLVCHGTREEVLANLERFARGDFNAGEIHARNRSKTGFGEINPSGKEFLFSQSRMAATTLTNVVFPIYCRGEYIRHYTPGRWWDCLYTWDSGFIGLGLLELDVERAVDCLKAYLTEPGDPHGPFVYRGSPVPVQIYLAREIWNRTGDRSLMEFLYPRLRQYHRFLAGHGPSTTRQFKSNLLATWDYFYNSGGWDDYPPQVHVHQNRLTGRVAPVANTAHAIRTARILRRLALEGLGPEENAGQYEEEIEMFSRAILDHARDSESGYFGYVCHDEEGRPSGILRHAGGVNFNMGMDGAYPLVAGIGTGEQSSRLLGFLKSEKHLWSRAGLSTVDQSAPYFNPGGYWNGSVWMPHQWFFWKSLLDHGESGMALRVAQRALEVWKAEVDQSHHCFEHFPIESGRGAGWHQFGGLSCPVLNWFAALHLPGRFTAGNDTWIASFSFNDHNRSLSAALKTEGRRDGRHTVMATMNPSHDYKATWNGDPVSLTSPFPGTLLIDLPRNDPDGTLKVERKQAGEPKANTFGRGEAQISGG